MYLLSSAALCKLAALAALLTVPACSTGEPIRVRDGGALLFSGRVRKTETLAQSERHHIALGGELGGYGTTGDYSSPSGTKDYRINVGYAAFVTEVGVGDFTVLPKVGIGAVDFAVAGQTTTVGDDGLGVLFGIETRYRLTGNLDAFARAASLQRSSLDSTMLEAGFGYHSTPYVVVECGYGSAAAVIDEAFDLLNTSNDADVEAQGLLLSVLLRF